MTAQTLSPTFRALTAADLEAVVALDRSITGQPRRGFYEKRLAAAAREPRAFISLAAENGGRLAGFVFAHLLDGEFGSHERVAVLDSLATSPDARRGGLGNRLLAALERQLRDYGVHELRTQAGWTERDLVGFFAAAGFALAPRLMLERDTAPAAEPQDGDLAAEPVVVRSLLPADLPAVIGVDRRVTGRDRTAYYKRKVAEALSESGVRVSQVAELDGAFVGFIMARVDFGEYGRAVATAVIDTIAVDPGFSGKGVGRALLGQLIGNLGSLRVESVNTEVDWDNFGLLQFLRGCGFKPSQRLCFSKRV